MKLISRYISDVHMNRQLEVIFFKIKKSAQKEVFCYLIQIHGFVDA